MRNSDQTQSIPRVGSSRYIPSTSCLDGEGTAIVGRRVRVQRRILASRAFDVYRQRIETTAGRLASEVSRISDVIIFMHSPIEARPSYEPAKRTLAQHRRSRAVDIYRQHCLRRRIWVFTR